jgi:hypothetical protein
MKNLSLISFIRYSKIAVAILMIAGLVWLAWFLYDNCYKPLTQALFVAELRTHVALKTVDKKGLDEIIALIEKNKQLPNIDWTLLPDPFTPRRSIQPIPPTDKQPTEPAPATSVPQ